MLIEGAIGTTLTAIGFALLKGNKKKLGTAKLGKNLGDLQGEKGIKISKKYCIRNGKLYENILCVAPIGEGKTSNLVINNLLGSHLPKSSKVIFDPKGEIHEIVSAYRASLGEENIVYEPLGSGVHYNPLDFCEDFTDVRDLAYTLLVNSSKGMKDETWVTMSMPLLTAALLYAIHMGKPYNTIAFALDTLICSNDNELLDLFKETDNVQIAEQFAIYLTAAKSDGTVGSIRSTIANGLALFSDPKIVESTKCSDFNFKDLRDRNRTINIFVKYNIDKATYLSTLLAIFFDQMVHHLASNYDEKNAKKVLIFADELQNLGKIPKLSNYLAYVRYVKIGVVACVQTFSALYDTYGKSQADAILANFKTKILFPSNSDPAVLDYFSRLSGEAEITIEQDKRMQKTKKQLYTADELRRLKSHYVLIMAHNKELLLDKGDYWKDNAEYVKNQRGGKADGNA